MSAFQPVIITAVVSVAVLSWLIVCAFIIGLVCEYKKLDAAELDELNAAAGTAENRPSSADCPMHGANCEAWL